MTTSTGKAALHRDDVGVPLVVADSEQGAFFGLGYAQAQDDLTGVLRQFLLVRGELTTVDGPAAAARDRNQQLWDVLGEARAGLAAMPPELQACYQAFVDGIGAFMAEHPAAVPGWAPALEPALPIGVNRTVMLYWTIADAVADLRADGIALGLVTSELDAARLAQAGSNAWVLAPWRTSTGETILLSDPHLPFGGTFAMHEATIDAPGLRYTGVAFLGAMIAPLAHTPATAWGLTTGGPRTSDAYRIEVDAHGRYRFDDEWRALHRTPAGGEYAIHNGLRAPVVARAGNIAYLVCSTYTGLAAQTEQGMLAALRATDAAGVYAAFAGGTFPPQNVIAADRAGATFYLRTGRVPRRPVDGARGVLDGSTSATGWTGLLPPDELVQLADPEAGFLQNCNTAPDTVAPDPALDAQKWAADAFNDVPGRPTCRGERALELLTRAFAVDVETVTAWADEDFWPDTPRWQAALTTAATNVGDWPMGRRRLLHTLLAFDGHATAASTAATVWVAWRTALARSDVDPVVLRDLAGRVAAGAPLSGPDRGLLLDAVVAAAPGEGRPYGEAFPFAPGVPGRGGAFLVRPPAPGDTHPDIQVSLRAMTFGAGGVVAGGPALRIVALGTAGTRSWSLPLTGRPDARAALYAAGQVRPCFVRPGPDTLVRVWEDAR